MRMLIKPRLIAATGLLLVGSFATAAPSVSDNTICWPDDGWYQVQDQATHSEVCGGGRSCDVEPGVYVVINHSTGERFNNITVVGDDEHTDGMAATAPESVQATLALVADKTFRISWPLSTAAQFYRVFENPDGISGFTDVSAELDATTTSFDHRVALFARVNAQYFVQSCNDQGCVDSELVMVTDTLDNAIGYFKASNTSPEDLFGRSISLNADGNTMAIGAMFEDGAATGVNGNQNDRAAGTSGAVFVFVRINGAWQQQAYIKASNTDSEDFFGIAVSLSADGNTLAVGATGEASSATGINSDQLNNSAENSGAVYVFERNNGNWRQEAYLKASNTVSGDSFGAAVSISADGGALAVGAPLKFGDSGAVYVFERSDGNWQQQAYLIASNPDSFDYFGVAVSLSLNGDTLAVGARGERSAATGIDGDQNDDSATASGAVYVFVRNSGDWQQQAYIKASNTDSGDAFGGEVSLSVDGNTLAVGAANEASSATGMDGDQNDDSARSSGAVYVFVRDNSDWQQQAYIKASNTDPGDAFGAGLSLSADGNTIAIGAQFEDSSSIGVNGNEDDNAAASAGAAYVFEYISGAWQQQAYIKASNTDSDDYFGGAVNLSADGNTLAVGAYQESSASIVVNGDQTDNTFVRSGAVYLY